MLPSIPGSVKRFFFSPAGPNWRWDSTQAPTGTSVYFMGIKRPGCEVDHLAAPIAEVKNGWSS